MLSRLWRCFVWSRPLFFVVNEDKSIVKNKECPVGDVV